MEPLSDAKIVDSWQKNALTWISAVREEQIESRNLVTNQAIIDAILSRSPNSVLDIGCGEGWLARELTAKGIHVMGVDVIPTLIEQAQAAGGGDFFVASYEEIAEGKLRASVDVAVCNFALFGKEPVEGLFRVVPSLLKPRGLFIVQTLHPVVACGDSPYQEGWRQGSWAGFSSNFTDPAPWYFRTLENWIELFVVSGFRLMEMHEPIHPKTQQPASVIFIAEVAG
ncbi:class I SAM-dependent methyltransferase [Chlorogloeopsis fritschii PCC 9212]|uniref:Methyltransferase n=1 Tax=Chlorogloeopsis fritschii PCC 6912 TaxID=211165 RepID=A0A433NQY0_CHLFR|nr:class I SAM-dependent methyltransferase [Chlorogloeopsis fritschii]MBF2005021.1 class I SAM-dependent methyltransferase [Chlorogloeopsis fritschii C42_A2020_084]RUR86603.1 methyltransferase [Chlorogloeopsis fritschii PCC 6912]